ncbi:DUF768 domain-containing protein [Mesorhizobium sp. B2-3-3]|nr:DUF768 domain-containing protein [Mesorhizobium sp. B2-3-3]
MPLNERPLRPPFSGAAPARGLNFLHQWLCHDAPQTAKSEMINPVDELTPRVDGRVDGRPGSYEAPDRWEVETPSPCIQGNREAVRRHPTRHGSGVAWLREDAPERGCRRPKNWQQAV